MDTGSCVCNGLRRSVDGWRVHRHLGANRRTALRWQQSLEVRFLLNALKKISIKFGHFSHFSYSGSDGTTRVESNYQKNLGGDEAGNSNQGSVIWTSPEGKQFTLSWVADEMGFHPVGDHLPTPPPIPEEIAKMLATLSPNDADYDYWGF